jgi:glyoxylase-like metal-dependent hydrolase (beta-lactamase superfamily II)
MSWKHLVVLAALAAQAQSAHHAPKPPKSLRLYIFDCGVLKPADAKSFGFDHVAELKMSVPCFLVAHPKGTMMWDVGVVPDTDFKPDGSPVNQGMMSVTRPLKPQLEAIGYEPEDIKYIAFSHYHIDHTANANMFAGSTWLVPQAERDIMFSDKPAPVRA